MYHFVNKTILQFRHVTLEEERTASRQLLSAISNQNRSKAAVVANVLLMLPFFIKQKEVARENKNIVHENNDKNNYNDNNITKKLKILNICKVPMTFEYS